MQSPALLARGRAAAPPLPRLPHRQPVAVGATPLTPPPAEGRPLRRAPNPTYTAVSSSTISTARRRRTSFNPAVVATRASNNDADATANAANAPDAGDPTNTADAAFLMNYLESCPPRIAAALKAIAADPRGALKQYSRDPEVMAALGTVLSRGMAPGRRAAIERLLASTAEEADEVAGGGGGAGKASPPPQQQQQKTPDIPAPGKVVSAMFSDPELARLMAEPEVKVALAAARAALLSGGGDAAARAALEGRGPKVDRAMELLEARLGRFVAAPGGTVDL